MGNVNTYIHLYVQFDIYMKLPKINKKDKSKRKQRILEKEIATEKKEILKVWTLL